MAEAQHSSSESESEEEDFGGFWGVVRDSWELLKNHLRTRQLFFITFGILLLCNIKFGPQLLETPTRSREQIVAANYIIYNSMIVTHMISFIYAIYLQFCITFPSFFGVTRDPRQGLDSSSESNDIGSSEWETEESGQYDSEHQPSSHARQPSSHARQPSSHARQPSSHAHSTVSRAVERVSEVLAPQVEPERPRTRSARRMALERERAAPTSMPPGRVYAEMDIAVSPDGSERIIDIRPVSGVRTRSQSRSQVEPSKPLRRKPPKRS